MDAVDVDLIGVMNLVHASPSTSVPASIIATGSLAAYLASMQGRSVGDIDARRRRGLLFAKQVVAHYVNDLSLQLAPKFIRVNAVHPTNVNTDMLHNVDMYRQFRLT